MGVEPTSQPWEGRILPMKYTRDFYYIIITNKLLKIKCFFAFYKKIEKRTSAASPA